MVARNPHLGRLQADYLFVEIQQRKARFLATREGPTQLIDLGIGDTSQPLPRSLVEAFHEAAEKLASAATYTGYGHHAGCWPLREAIAQKFYGGRIAPDEVFVSDGAKCDLGRLQQLFGQEVTVALQDPTYPAYRGATLVSGRAHQPGGTDKLIYLPCHPANGFCPSWDGLPSGCLVYLCSPNNPTGEVLTHEQLRSWIEWAKASGSFLLFDGAYSSFIDDPSLPRSIFEVEGAHQVAIEMNSFSKRCGFTGVRLGWSVVPQQARFDDGMAIHPQWDRLTSLLFNGPSILAQAGGVAALTDEGLKAQQEMAAFYRANGQLLRQAIEAAGYLCYGGRHAPFLWLDANGIASWSAFEQLLHQGELVTIPGVGFGPAGEGFLRLSALGHRPAVEEAAERLFHCLPQLARQAPA